FGHLYLDSQHRVFPSAQSKMDVENLLRMSLTELADILRKIDSCDDEDIKDVLYFLHNLK
ncbi:MAG: hypothetical protein RSH78_03880, partial [Bacilli bacterium]